MIQAAARQPAASPARTPEAASRPSTAAPAATGRGALPAGLTGAGGPPSRWSLGAPNAAAEREAEDAAERIGRGQRAGPMSAGGGDAVVRGDGATADAGPVPQPAARALDGLSSGGGQPLSAPQMAFFGDAFSGPGRSSEAVRRSLAPVRVHTDARASTVLEHTGAAAANVGAHVMSRPSDYSPDSPDGGPHFPHEIAHALQPGGQARNGVVRRLINDKSGSNVDRPTWKSTNLKKPKLDVLKSIYNTLLHPLTIYTFPQTADEIRAGILSHAASGASASAYFTSAAMTGVTRRGLYGPSLQSNWLSKTDRHEGNYRSYLDLHLNYILSIEGATTNKSTLARTLITSELGAARREASQADSRVSTDADINGLSDRIRNYHSKLNDSLVSDGQPGRRMDVAVPRFKPFANDQEMGSGASLTISPYSSLAQGSSSNKNNANTRAVWEDYLDSRIYEGKVLYVRGHIVNANLSGPELPINLVPLTYRVQPFLHSANDRHSTDVEEGVKRTASGLLDQKDDLSNADLSGMHNRFAEITYDVNVDYAKKSGEAREKLRLDALKAVLAAGTQVANQIPPPPTTVGATPSVSASLDTADPAAVLGALAKHSSIALDPSYSSLLNPAFRAIPASSKTAAQQYQLLLENAGLWDYDYQYVPRSLLIKKSSKIYSYDDDTDQLAAISADEQEDTIVNGVGWDLGDYPYQPDKKRSDLANRTKSALPAVKSALPRPQGGTPSVPSLSPNAPSNSAQAQQVSTPQQPPPSGGQMQSFTPVLPPQTQGLQPLVSPSSLSRGPVSPTRGDGPPPSPHTPTNPVRPSPPQSQSQSQPQYSTQQMYHQPPQQNPVQVRAGPLVTPISVVAPPKAPPPSQPQPPQTFSGALSGMGTGLFGNNGAPLRFDQMDASGKPITPQYYTQPYNPRPPNGGVVNSSSSPPVQQTQSSSTTQFGQGFGGGSLSPSMTLPLDPYGAFGASFLDDAVRWQIQLQIAQAALQASERQRQQQSVQAPVQPVFTQQTPVQPTLLTSPPIHTPPPQQYRPPQPQSPQPVLVQSTPSQPVSQPARYPLPGAWTYSPPQHQQPQPPRFVQPTPSQPVTQPARYPLPGDPGPGQQQFSAPTPVRQAFYTPTPTTPNQGGGVRGSGVARPTASQPRNPRPRTDDDDARQDKRYRGGYSDEDLAVLAFNVTDEEFRVAGTAPSPTQRLARARVIFAELQAERDELNNQDNAKRFRKGPRDDSGKGGGGFGGGGSGFGSGGGGFSFGGGGFNFNGGTGVF